MVQVRECQGIFLINTVWRVHIIDQERSSESVNVLSTNMSVIPVSTRLRNFEFVNECRTRFNRTLSHHSWSIGIRGISLLDSMEMYGSCFIAKVVRDGKDDGITHIDRNCWARPLSIDSHERSSISIRGRRYPPNAPSVTSSLSSWRSDIG